MTAPADSSVLTKVFSIGHTLFVFFPSFFFQFTSDNWNYWSLFRNCIKMKIFFYFLQTFIQKLTLVLLRQIYLGNNLLTHIRKNADFSRQLPSAEAKFEGALLILVFIIWCVVRKIGKLFTNTLHKVLMI